MREKKKTHPNVRSPPLDEPEEAATTPPARSWLFAASWSSHWLKSSSHTNQVNSYNDVTPLLHRHAAPSALWSSIPREIKIPGVQRQRVTRCRQVVELGSIIPAGLLGSSSKAPARSTIRHIVAESVQRRVSVDLHSWRTSRRFPPIRQAAWRNVSPRSAATQAAVRASFIIIRNAESRAKSSCSDPPLSDTQSHLDHTRYVPRTLTFRSRHSRKERKFGLSEMSGRQARDQPRERERKNIHITQWSARDWAGWWGISESRVKWGWRLRPRDACALRAHARRVAGFSRPFIRVIVCVFSTRFPRDELIFVRDVIRSVKNTWNQ